MAYQLAAVGQTLIDQGQLGDARDQLLKAARCGLLAGDIDAAINAARQNGYVLLYAARTVQQSDPAAAADLARQAMDAMDPGLSPHHQAQAQRLYQATRPGPQ